MANLIFDLDGTLWSTLGTATQAWNDALDTLRLTKFRITESQMLSQVGKPRSEILACLFPTFSKSQLEEMAEVSWKFSFKRISKLGGKIYLGVIQTLAQLHQEGHQLFIVSNCQRGYIEIFLNQSKTNNLFIDHECWGNTLKEKSYNIKLLMHRNQVQDAFYIGDTAGDQIAANKAGVLFIEASYGFGELMNKGWPSIDSFEELLLKV